MDGPSYECDTVTNADVREILNMENIWIGVNDRKRNAIIDNVISMHGPSWGSTRGYFTFKHDVVLESIKTHLVNQRVRGEASGC